MTTTSAWRSSAISASESVSRSAAARLRSALGVTFAATQSASTLRHRRHREVADQHCRCVEGLDHEVGQLAGQRSVATCARIDPEHGLGPARHHCFHSGFALQNECCSATWQGLTAEQFVYRPGLAPAPILDSGPARRSIERVTAGAPAKAAHWGFVTPPPKILPQSFFMLTTIQPRSVASPISAWEKVPMCESGRPLAGP